jgi:hypothetical protein
VRFDNKLPKFTNDEIDGINIDLTYGGFDRINGQLLFSYRSFGSNLTDITQDKVLVYNYEESTWAINDMRFSVFGQAISGETIAWNAILGSDEHPSWSRMDTTEEIWDRIGTTNEEQKTLAGDNYGFVYEINNGFNDYFVSVSNITTAANAVATIAESAFKPGDQVIFQNVEGMTEINDQILTVLSSTSTSITLDINSALFTPYSTKGTVEKVIDFKAELVPFNPYRKFGKRCYINHIEVLLNTDSNPLYVDFIADEEETPYKTVLLQPKTTSTKARQWISAIVDSEENFHSIIFRNKAHAKQTVITSIRIHAMVGGFTSG